MAYIGIDPNVGDISFQQFTGDGSTTAFTLAQSVASGEAIIVTIGNVVQEPGASAAYTAYANTLTFSAAPVNGDVITVRYFGRAVDQPLSYGMQLFKYVATASQTVFTGADSNGAILAFSGTDVDVYLNGVHLDADDFTPSSGNTITLATGASLNDDLVVRAFRAFSVTDTVSASSGGTFNGAVTFDAGANFGDNDKAVFGAGSDLQIYHNGSDSYIIDDGTGNLNLRASSQIKIQSLLGEDCAIFNENGSSSLQYDNATKLATTATGVDVTGTVTATGDIIRNDATTGTSKFALQYGGSDAAVFKRNNSTGVATIANGYAGAPVDVININLTGNVGIGESNPVAKTHIQGSGTSGQVTASLILENSSSGTAGMDITGSAGSSRLRFLYGGGPSTGTNTLNEAINIVLEGSNAGNVGIGTSSPLSLLHVDGADAIIRLRDLNGGISFIGHDSIGAYWRTFTTDTHRFLRASGTESMRIDSSGNVGIGATLPSSNAIVKFLEIEDATSAGLVLDGPRTYSIYSSASSSLVFRDETASYNWMILESSGNVGIGQHGAGGNRLRVSSDNPTNYGNAQFEIYSGAGNVLQSFHAGGATAVMWKHPRGVNVIEARNNPDTGYININAAAFTVSSDYRLKENVTYDWDATTRLKQLKPARFNFKPFEETGEEHHSDTVDGFLAHEVSHDSDGNPLVPEAITGTKDAMRDEQYVVTPAVLDDDGNEITPAVMGTRSVPDYQKIDQSKLTPLLTKALIEAVEKIEQLEARITALETN